MTMASHDPQQCVTQLRQTLAADKLSVGFLIGAGCPCAVRVPDAKDGEDRPLIPDIKGLTAHVHESMTRSKEHVEAYKKLTGLLIEDGEAAPTIETMLNRTLGDFRAFGGFLDEFSAYGTFGSRGA